jgi:hypothetical protein
MLGEVNGRGKGKGKDKDEGNVLGKGMTFVGNKIGYPERYYVVPVRYYVVPTFFGVLWVLCIVPMGTVGYC